MKFNSISLFDLVENIVDNRGKTCPTVNSGIPLIATNCVLNDHLYPVFDKVRYVDEKTYESWFRGHPEPGDMLFVNKGTPGRVCWVPEPVGFCIAQDMVAIRAKKDIVYPKYLLALLRSDIVQKEIENLHVGTLIPHFKKGDFDRLILSVPTDYQFQKRVGDFYFNISEKIEINRQINATLEAITQAIFKEWFVNFRFPGATGQMQDSELGPIPKGWKILPLDEIANFLNGLPLQQYPPENGEDMLPVIKIRELRNGITESSDKASSTIPEEYIIHDGDLIFSWSGTLEVKFWVGGVGALNQHLFKVTSDEYPLWLCYFW